MKKLILLLLFSPLVSFGQTAQEYYDKGKSYFDLKQYYNAISDFDKSIELDPEFRDVYFYRVFCKDELEDYYGAISDYNKAIELDPDYTSPYVNRGIAKELINDLTGACLDWKKAASLGSTNAAKWVANQCN